MGNTLCEVRENRPQIVELAVGDVKLRVREDLDSVSDELINLATRRIQERVAAALEPLVHGALERACSEAEERFLTGGGLVPNAVSTSLAHALEQFQLRLGERTETFSDNFKKLEESLAEAEAERQKTALSSFRKALEQECAEALAKMQSDFAQVPRGVSDPAAQQASSLNDLPSAVEEGPLQTLADMKDAAPEPIPEIPGPIERLENMSHYLSEGVQGESPKPFTNAKSEAHQAIPEVSKPEEWDVEAINDLRKSQVGESAPAPRSSKRTLARWWGRLLTRRTHK